MTADPCDIIDLDSEPVEYRPDGLAAERWAPDMQLVPAIISVPKWSRRLTDYDEPDRCWIVAGLTLAGWSANEIIERVGGSIRLIRDIRSKAMTEACRLWQIDTGRIEAELRVERINHTATHAELAQATRTAERLRTQRDQILDAHATGQIERFRCGCPKVRYNVYEHGGKQYCRECDRTRKSRKRRNLAAVS